MWKLKGNGHFIILGETRYSKLGESEISDKWSSHSSDLLLFFESIINIYILKKYKLNKLQCACFTILLQSL